ncbi:hypothetical protein FFT09_10855 [Saccharomonospora piscinae]|uniref:hypothetical protein n=1 Tax=Saccharomonospora piscinae TaxID=687388 RepID=UPI0011075A50|nr:hypothetical protein [Saccharomonospora piscinae]TLW93846.1 hypothetical protein FFT09_10855 [Saccharomonospora piscinae]
MTDTAPAESAGATPPWDEPGPDRRLLSFAVAMAVFGACLAAVGAILPTLEGAASGFTSGPVLLVTAALPAVVAAVLFVRSRTGGAAGVLVGAAVLAPAALLFDLGLLQAPGMATRPELYLPVSLSEPRAGFGLWALLAGHGAAVVAGGWALTALRREPVGESAGLADGDGAGDGAGDDGVLDPWRRRAVRVAVPCSALGACGLLMAPFGSRHPILLDPNAFERPLFELLGLVSAALLLPLGAALLAVLPREASVVRGGLAGLALAALGFAVPSLAAALAMPSLDVAPGPWLVLVAVVGLLTAVGWAVRPDSVRESSAPRGEVRLPGRRRLELAAGALALGTAVAAIAGALLPQVVATGAATAPESPARWVLLVAGVLVGVLGSALFVPRVAAALRPALSVAWVAIPLAATAVLDTALASGYAPSSFSPAPDGPAGSVLGHFTPGSVESGPGVVWTWLALVGAVVTACCVVVAGVVEREDAGEQLPEPETGGRVTGAGLRMLTPLTAAGVLSVAAFATPTVTAPDYVEAGLVSHVGPPTWGLVAAVLTVCGAVLLAARSRPARAAALLAGAAGVVALRAATLPLTAGEVSGSSAGTGFWLALAALVALAASAAIAATEGRRGDGA